MDPIGFFYMVFQILWQRQVQLVWAFLMLDPHLHVCDRYISLFKTGWIWNFDPSGLFQDIKRSPGFVQLLAGLLRCLWRKLFIPQISFMCFFRNCSVPSQLRVKMHSESPSVMAFCLVCLGILAKNMPKHLAGYYLLNSYLFSDNTSQDTFPVPALYNDGVHSCRHSRVWKLHNTYAL